MKEFSNNYFLLTHIELGGVWSYNIHVYIHLLQKLENGLYVNQHFLEDI